MCGRGWVHSRDGETQIKFEICLSFYIKNLIKLKVFAKILRFILVFVYYFRFLHITKRDVKMNFKKWRNSDDNARIN